MSIIGHSDVVATGDRIGSSNSILVAIPADIVGESKEKIINSSQLSD